MEIKDRGFTYTEVLIALLIVVIGFIMIFNLSFIAVTFGNFNKDVVAAKEISNALIDSLKELPYSDTLLMDDGDTNDLKNISNPDHIIILAGRDDDGDDAIDEEIYNRVDDDDDGLIDEDLKKFSVVLNIADNQPLENTKTISVIVYWHYRKVLRKVVMTAIKRRY